MKIRSLLVDDNLFNLEVLTDLLRDSGHPIVVEGVANNGMEAVKRIEELKPDLVFLDVEMPDMNGFDVLASLETIDFQTIFVTAHSQYAIKAIRFNALDYLVKPIDPKELDQAITRYLSNGKNQEHQQRIQVALHNWNKDDSMDQVLFLPTQEGGIKMALRDIIKVEGDRNYSTFHLINGKTKISAKTLGHFEEILEGKNFFRCHRSFVVNRLHIDKIDHDSFLLKNSTLIPISRRRKSKAKSWFHELSK